MIKTTICQACSVLALAQERETAMNASDLQGLQVTYKDSALVSVNALIFLHK